MRYYLYISESKIEMLYSQIPPESLDNISRKLMIDLKIIKAEFSELPKNKTIHEKLIIIEKYLLEEKLVGSIQNPSKYIAGNTIMKMADYEQGLVYFGGVGETIIGLGGSSKNVVGNIDKGIAHSHSATPHIVKALTEKNNFENYPLLGGSRNDESMTLAGVELASSQMSGLNQRMEFLAKTILVHPSNDFEYTWGGQCGKPVILGTPLYVALLN